MSGSGEKDPPQDKSPPEKRAASDELGGATPASKFPRSSSPARSASGQSTKSSLRGDGSLFGDMRGSRSTDRRKAANVALKAATEEILDPKKAYETAMNGQLVCGRASCKAVYVPGQPWGALLKIEVDGNFMVIGVTDKCYDCGETHVGFETLGPWELVKNLCNASPEFDAKFKAADTARKTEKELRAGVTCQIRKGAAGEEEREREAQRREGRGRRG